MEARRPDFTAVCRELSRRKHLDFIRYVWPHSNSFIIGHHTIAICDRIDRAIADYRQGKSTNLIVMTPPRHGKSEILSRCLPPHFLGEFPDREIIVASYGADLSEEFSKNGRAIMRSDEYKKLYPHHAIAQDNQGVEQWGVEIDGQPIRGKVQFVGIGGAVTGKGADMLLIDDYCKNRMDAESEVYRNRTWNGFANDLMTRRAPVSIVIILATCWHVDDLIGRIQTKMNEDNLFPKFEILKFPARSKNYTGGILFPERFENQWYDSMESVLGPYASAAMLQCEPRLQHGNRLNVDKITIVDPREWEQNTGGMEFTRGWDLASSTEERLKDDPDYTSGAKVAVRKIKSAIPGMTIDILFIDDYVRGKWEAGERNQIILSTAIKDGEFVRIGVEAFGGYKDAYTQLRDALRGLRAVNKVNLPGDKGAKASCLESIFAAGNVYMKEASWNNAVIKQLSEFPSGVHDDDVDALVVAYWLHKSKTDFGWMPGV